MSAAPYAVRRKHPRFSVDVQVGLTVGSGQIAARTRDMSRAGVCLVAMKGIAPETEIALQLVLTFGEGGMSEPLKVLGKVAWCTALFGAYQIGVKFVKVDDDCGRYLDMFIGFLDGTLAPSGTIGPDDDTLSGADPDDPFAL
jgi:hypothetical protein